VIGIGQVGNSLLQLFDQSVGCGPGACGWYPCYDLIPRKPGGRERWKTTVVGQARGGLGKSYHQTDELDRVSNEGEEGLVALGRILVAASEGEWALGK
jgi:hypothetical protein